MATKRAYIQEDLDLLRDSLADVPEPLARPVLVVVSGLPGTGKSYFSRRMAQRVPVAIVETDRMRKVLFPSPTHSATESARLFRACHSLIEELLSQGVPVLLDATNLVESHRELLYNIAHKTNARLILVRVEAPAEVVSQRLARRGNGTASGDSSDADWSVYRRMKSSVEPIRRNHFAVDTSRDITPVIEKVAREVNRWVKV
ncbi:MAG: ATP-binding protein [Chloroflexi bacterium]|nr:ATP-binding protein [Chloroflexota bacterium]